MHLAHDLVGRSQSRGKTGWRGYRFKGLSRTVRGVALTCRSTAAMSTIIYTILGKFDGCGQRNYPGAVSALKSVGSQICF